MVPCFNLCHAFSFSPFNMYQTNPIVYHHPVFQCCFLLNCFFILCRKYITNNLSQSSVLILVYASKDPLSTQGWAHSYFITIHWFRATTYFHWFFNYRSSSYTMIYHDPVSVLWHAPCASFYIQDQTQTIWSVNIQCFSHETHSSGSSLPPQQIHHIAYRHSLCQCCSTY